VESIRFEREYRTSSSEGYLILEGEDRVGRLELHFAPELVFGTVIIERDMAEDEVQELIETVDDELVISAQVPREDFVVTVYQGREVGVFSDESFEDEQE